MEANEIDRADSILPLSFDEVLNTTRAVRKRLDLSRPVDREVLLDCTRLAQQAPTGRNRQRWDFVFVTDPQQKARVAHWWRLGQTTPPPPARQEAPGSEGVFTRGSFSGHAWEAMQGGVGHLSEHLHEVPVFLIPCLRLGSRAELDDLQGQAIAWASVLPSVWSFMLAARSRGLGTVWTTLHLSHEREVAAELGLDYDTVVQCGLIPVAHTIGTDFKPADRVPAEEVVHWNHW